MLNQSCSLDDDLQQSEAVTLPIHTRPLPHVGLCSSYPLSLLSRLLFRHVLRLYAHSRADNAHILFTYDLEGSRLEGSHGSLLFLSTLPPDLQCVFASWWSQSTNKQYRLVGRPVYTFRNEYKYSVSTLLYRGLPAAPAHCCGGKKRTVNKWEMFVGKEVAKGSRKRAFQKLG